MPDDTFAFTHQQIRDAVIAEIEFAGPGYVYEAPLNDDGFDGGTCFYVQDGCSSCLVGRALDRLGVPIEKLQQHDPDEHGDGAMPAGMLPYWRGAEITQGWITVLQQSQDGGHPWAVALTRADARWPVELA